MSNKPPKCHQHQNSTEKPSPDLAPVLKEISRRKGYACVRFKQVELAYENQHGSGKNAGLATFSKQQ